MEGDADSSFGDRPFPCHTCGKKYLRKNNLEDHVLMEHPDTVQVATGCRGRSSAGRTGSSPTWQADGRARGAMVSWDQ